MAARGIPPTTHVSSLCAMVMPPAALIAPIPSAPSSPIPLMMIPTEVRPKSCATEWKSTSADGRWPLMGGVSERNHFPARHAADHHMAIAGTDEDAPGNEQITGFGFVNIQRATLIEAAGKHVGKSFGHVLYDDEGRGKIRGKLSEQILKRIGTASRNADGDHAIGRKGRARAFLG